MQLVQISHVPPNPATLTWTGVRTARECWRGFEQRFVAQAPALAAVELERGSGVHEILHAVGLARFEGRELDDSEIARLIERHAAVLLPEAADDLRAVAVRAIERDYLPRLPSDAQDVGFERPFAIDENGVPCEWDSPRAIFRSIFDVCYRENGGLLGVNDDYKTSRLITAPAEQSRLYAWAMSCLHPDLEEVLVRLRYVRYGIVKDLLYDAEDLAELRATVPLELRALRDEVIARTAANDWPTRISDACRYCAYRGTCPAMRSDVEPVLAIDTDEEACLLADAEVVLAIQLTEVRAALKAWTTLHGAIDLGAEEYGPRAVPHETVADVATAAAILTERGVTAEKLYSCLSLPKTELSKLVTAAISDAPKRERKDAREAVMRQLRDERALVDEPTVKFGRRAKSDETPAEEAA